MRGLFYHDYVDSRSPLLEVLAGKLVFEGGTIRLITKARGLRDLLSEAAPGSLVEVEGDLVEHLWQRGDGRQMATHHFEPHTIRLVENARVLTGWEGTDGQ